VTLETPQEAAQPNGLDSGVIEEARVRQRRRRVTGAVIGGVAAVVIALLLLGGVGSGSPGPSARPEPGRPLKLTLVHGRAFIGGKPALMGVTWSLQAGNVGVCVRVIGTESCNGQPPTNAYPVYGGGEGYGPEEKVGRQGEIDAIFTGPGVAAMRVAHLGTFKAESAPGLPPGAKQIVFYRPPGSPGTVLPPGMSPAVLQGFEHAKAGPALTETLLDSRGHPIRTGSSPTFTLPNSYWHGSEAPPAAGRCAMSSSLPGVRTEWGQVATQIAGDPSITSSAWLSCLHVWFAAGGASYETAILLNGKSPGATPAPLWGAVPVPGHPGVVEIPPIQREVHFTARAGLRTPGPSWDQFVPPGVARRVGPAWVLVTHGRSLAQRIAFLESLHVTKLPLPR
jgi:hypothetical protein